MPGRMEKMVGPDLLDLQEKQDHQARWVQWEHLEKWALKVLQANKGVQEALERKVTEGFLALLGCRDLWDLKETPDLQDLRESEAHQDLLVM